MKILFIAPLPPPITGQSLASKVLLEELKKFYYVKVVNFNKGNFEQGINSISRIFQVIKILYAIWIKSRNVDVVYLTISQGIASNIKDIFTYLVCFKKLDKTIIHLHGGGIRKLIFDKYKPLYCFNKFFLKRMGGAIVLGKSLANIFAGMVPGKKIHIVPNFAEDFLFLDAEKIRQKFTTMKSLRILFLSNLIPGKGHEELLEAYESLELDLQKRVKIDFAGGFKSEIQRKMFLKKIKGIERIEYHGIVSGKKKKELFLRAHIFCLPTYYYYYEGQPISILEAYASGCVVIATDHGGIKDIFEDGANGFLVNKRDSVSIKEVIENILKHSDQSLNIAMYNKYFAENNFNESKYCSSLIRIIRALQVENNN